MPVTFRNAPLVEIIVEVRWNPSAATQTVNSGGPMAFNVPIINSRDQNAFSSSLQIEMHKIGFSISERLIPPNFFAAPFQVTQRFRSVTDTALFQAGIGVFTINAVPPYESWHVFETAIRQGLEALFQARQGAEQGAPFLSASLRYINHFGARHLGGKTPAAFMRDVLGIYTREPEVIERYRTADHPQSESVNLTFEIADEMLMTLTAAEGLGNGEHGLVFDLNVSSQPGKTVPQEGAVAMICRAHDIIHDIFTETTSAIRDVMKPEEVGQ